MRRTIVFIAVALLTIASQAKTQTNEVETFTVNGVSFKMIHVEGGTFMMGATDDDQEAVDEEKPAHQVTVSSFGIGETEVTQELWTAVMGNNPSYYADIPHYPVESVSWYDCQVFISKLNEITGRYFRLPTEAELEFAARGGNNSQGYLYSGSNYYSQVMWCSYNSSGLNNVAQKAPNELGIYDMSGNVWEWCQDWYSSYTSEAQTDPTGPDTGTDRVRRGGGFSSIPKYCRITYRSYAHQTSSTNIAGLRLALSEGPAPEPPTHIVSETFTVNDVTFKMIQVEGGTYMMGAADDDQEAEDAERPAHQVTVSTFSIGETEVTQELWTAVMGSNPSYFAGNLQRPVERVSWNDCQSFISKLNELTGRQFRLPTEAEWEFAARGGNESQGYPYAGGYNYYDVLWSIYSCVGTVTVADKMPNELGLYDMSGNVWEWCQDRFGSYSSEAQTNPTGPASGNYRVIRGGCWSSTPESCRVSSRGYYRPSASSNVTGLRLVLSEEPTLEQTEAPDVYTWTGTQGDHTQYVRYDAPEDNCEMQYRYKYNDGEWTEWTTYDDVLTFTENGTYEVEGRAKAPGKEWSEATPVTFVVSPHTGIGEVIDSKTVASIRYYNIAGQEMTQPHGITIMVTTYTDGTTTAVKVMK